MPMNYSAGRTDQFPGDPNTRKPRRRLRELRLTDEFDDTFVFRYHVNGSVLVSTDFDDPDVELCNVWLSDAQRRELLEFLR